MLGNFGSAVSSIVGGMEGMESNAFGMQEADVVGNSLTGIENVGRAEMPEVEANFESMGPESFAEALDADAAVVESMATGIGGGFGDRIESEFGKEIAGNPEIAHTYEERLAALDAQLAKEQAALDARLAAGKAEHERKMAEQAARHKAELDRLAEIKAARLVEVAGDMTPLERIAAGLPLDESANLNVTADGNTAESAGINTIELDAEAPAVSRADALKAQFEAQLAANAQRMRENSARADAAAAAITAQGDAFEASFNSALNEQKDAAIAAAEEAQAALSARRENANGGSESGAIDSSQPVVELRDEVEARGTDGGDADAETVGTVGDSAPTASDVAEDAEIVYTPGTGWLVDDVAPETREAIEGAFANSVWPIEGEGEEFSNFADGVTQEYNQEEASRANDYARTYYQNFSGNARAYTTTNPELAEGLRKAGVNPESFDDLKSKLVEDNKWDDAEESLKLALRIAVKVGTVIAVAVARNMAKDKDVPPALRIMFGTMADLLEKGGREADKILAGNTQAQLTGDLIAFMQAKLK